MDQLSIQTIEYYLDVPLIASECIHDLDAKKIAAALAHLDAKVVLLMERLREITELIDEAIENCETCRSCDDNPGCARCLALGRWLQEGKG